MKKKVNHWNQKNCPTTKKKLKQTKLVSAHALSSIERILGHFLWGLGPMKVTIQSQKIDFLTKICL